LAGNGVYLRIWSPRLAALESNASIAVAIVKLPRYSTSPGPRQITLDRPLPLPAGSAHERVYALPADLSLAPLSEYAISGWIPGQPGADRLFSISFHTSKHGQPLAF
jgi:hypothetical protein